MKLIRVTPLGSEGSYYYNPAFIAVVTPLKGGGTYIGFDTETDGYLHVQESLENILDQLDKY